MSGHHRNTFVLCGNVGKEKGLNIYDVETYLEKL